MQLTRGEAGTRTRNEHTLATSCQIEGRGYWSGKDVRVNIHPAPAGTGITLVRSDLDDGPTCPATINHRIDASLRTNLVSADASFQMVEHLLAALAALEIDNCIVEIDAEELPALDGSSGAFVRALTTAGLIIQARAKRQLIINNRYRVGTPDGWVEAKPAKTCESYFEYQLSFDDQTPIAPQAYGVELTPGRFIREIATARTFVTEEQADQIRSTGMASHVTNQDLLVIGYGGPIDNQFRYTNECARHKTLDLIGDLALSGIEAIGRFTSFRGGHQLNGKMARLLLDLYEQQSATNNHSNQRQTDDFNEPNHNAA